MKLFLSLISGIALTALPVIALATDPVEIEAPDTSAYDDCYDIADEQATADNWNEVFNNCLREKGVTPSDEGDAASESGDEGDDSESEAPAAE